MSNDQPNLTPSEPINPYSPPLAALNESPVEDAEPEAMRRKFLARENFLKMLGIVALFCAIAEACIFLPFLYQKIQSDSWQSDFSDFRENDPSKNRFVALFLLDRYILPSAFIGLQIILGTGLLKLRTWAFWTQIVVSSAMSIGSVLPFLTNKFWNSQSPAEIRWRFLIFGIIQMILLFYLIASRTKRVVSAEHQRVISQTNHLRRSWNWWLRLGLIPIFMGLFIGYAFMMSILAWSIANFFFVYAELYD